MSRRAADPTRQTTPEPPDTWAHRISRLVMLMVALVVVASATTVGAVLLVQQRLNTNVHRIGGAFDGLDAAARPSAVPHSPGQTVLAVGLDLRSPGQTTGDSATDPQDAAAGDRSDTIMLIRFDPQGESATVVSIPRDAWVPIPGKGTMKINAAYSLGGAPLLIATVERLTGIRIDHFMVIDFAGFRSLVDALGGVDVDVATATTDLGGVHFTAGVNHLDGVRALAYVRQRYGLPDGDLDRVRRQQNLLRAVLSKSAQVNATNDPLATYRLLDAVTRAVTVDSGYTAADLRTLALQAVQVPGDRVVFLTAPIIGTGWEGDQSVVHLDPARDAQLWHAFAAGTMAGYAEAHRADLLPQVTR